MKAFINIGFLWFIRYVFILMHYNYGEVRIDGPLTALQDTYVVSWLARVFKVFLDGCGDWGGSGDGALQINATSASRTGQLPVKVENLWKPRIWKKTWERHNPHFFSKSKDFTRSREYSDYNDISAFHQLQMLRRFEPYSSNRMIFGSLESREQQSQHFFQVWQRSPNLHRKIEKSRGFQPDCFFFGTKFQNALKSQQMVFPVVLKLATETPSLNAKSISSPHCFIHRLDRKMMKRVLYSLYTPYTIFPSIIFLWDKLTKPEMNANWKWIRLMYIYRYRYIHTYTRKIWVYPPTQ